MAMKGKDGFSKHLKGMQRDAAKVANAVVFVGAQMIESHAKVSITKGSASGRSGGKHQHQPSAPGTPPNNFSDVLAKNIEASNPAPLLAKVTSSAPYAAIQEYGGTIRHPGGTAYFMRDGKPVFVGKGASAAFMYLPKTKPHPITLPPRPYMRPARDAEAPKIRRMFEEKIDELNKRTAK